MRARATGIALFAATCIALACVRAPASATTAPVPVVVTSDYPALIARAMQTALAGRYGEADSMLVAFQQRAGDSPETRDAAYWRAVLALDPANTAASDRRAGELLDVYLADSALANHRAEAQVLRRLVNARVAMQTELDRAHATPPPNGVREQDLAKENAALKDQLAKITAELERIRKRLGAPKG